MKKTVPVFLLMGLVSLASCSLFPTSTSSASSQSSSKPAESSQESSSFEPSTEPSSEQSSAPISSLEESIPLPAEPTLSLPIGTYKNRVEISKHQYSTLDYHITLPYEGNKYEFPAPVLSNYDGDYDLVYSDSDTIKFTKKDDLLFIEAKYQFGGYFHMAASNKQGEVIDSLYIQLETSQVGEGQLHFFNYSTNEEIEDGSTVTLSPGASLRIKPTLNTKTLTDVITSSNPEVVAVTSTNYYTNLKATNVLGESLIKMRLSERDSVGTLYEYSASFTIQVYEDQSLSSIYLEGEEVYLVSGQPKYNGTFYAEFANGAKVAIDEEDIAAEVLEGNKVRFSYTHDEITKTVTYSAKAVNGSSYPSTRLGHSYTDYMKHYSTGRSSLPLTGNLNFLVIPIWFTNSTTYFDISKKEEIREDINTICFGSAPMGSGTLKTFYESESQGKLTITGKVADWYIDEYESALYSDMILDTVQGLFDRAIEDYIAKNPDDTVANYDRNEDGKYDGVIFYYAANYYGNRLQNASDGFALNFNDEGVGGNTYMNNCCFCPVGAIYGYRGEVVDEQKTTGDLSTLRPESFQDGASIVIHEVGHMLGAIDLYTAAGNAVNQQGSTAHYYAGNFSMQDNNKGGHDPIQTYLFNWGEPMVFSADKYELGTKINVLLDDFQATHSSILLSPSWNEHNSPFDEYMLLELFSPSGLNEFSSAKTKLFDSTGAGVRLWHADAALMKDNNNKRGYWPDQNGISFIASNHDVWDMNNFHFAHMIRNDESADYEPLNGMSPDDLFKANDSFSPEKFQNQFVDGDGILDSGRKLGWEFKVTSLFHNGNGGYGASVELTRVSDVITEFKAETVFPSKLNTFPSGTDVDATSFFGLNADHLTLTCSQNGSATALSVAYQSPDYYLLLGKEAYVELSIKKTDGEYIGVIKKIQLIYMLGTTVTSRGTPTVYIGNNVVEGSRDPLDTPIGEPYYMSAAYSYELNSGTVRIYNKGDNNLYLNCIRIEYSILHKTA